MTGYGTPFRHHPTPFPNPAWPPAPSAAAVAAAIEPASIARADAIYKIQKRRVKREKEKGEEERELRPATDKLRHLFFLFIFSKSNI